MPSHQTYTSGRLRAENERYRDPTDVIAEAEQQWIFSEDELLRTPSILDGMDLEAEKTARYKGSSFISQVGLTLKLPQTTLLAAGVFFNRFLMRYSLVNKEGHKALHHYQVAATSLFLATKVEENSRKIRDLVISCCRVAQKNLNLIVDENTKDYWRWRDTILYNEDVLLEQLCFDLTVESPYKILFDLLRYYGVEKNRKLRDSAWSFLNDGNMTQLCLLFTSRIIACASLFCGAKHVGIAFEDERGRPWWEVQRASLREIRRACNYMADFYTNAPGGLKPASEGIYVGLRSPLDGNEDEQRTRLIKSQTPMTPAPMERSGSEMSLKREREDEPSRKENGDAVRPTANGHPPIVAEEGEKSAKRTKLDDRLPLPEGNGAPTLVPAKEDDAGSEEGEVEE